MKHFSFVSVLYTALVVCLHQPTLAQHAGEETPMGGEMETTSKAPSPCAIPLETLYQEIENIFEANYTVYINCLSFDKAGSLETAVVSGTSPTGPDQRYVVECLGNILVALESQNPVATTDIRDMDHASCVQCVDVAPPTDTCVTPCPNDCERCYDKNSTVTCTRCRACLSQEAELCTYTAAPLTCAETCPPATTINHEEYNHCECTGVRNLLSYPAAGEGEEEIECHEEEEERPYRCDETCRIVGHRVNNQTGICFACGIENCVMCRDDVCLTCLAETVLYEHECIACPLAPIAIEAIEQEHEVEEEEAEKDRRTIELAVILPIISVLIIVFFVSVSIFAHRRYPHISYHGQKRHRRKPTHERSLSPEDDTEQLQQSQVWRARPTIVLR